MNGNWKGGRTRHKKGYVWVLWPEHHRAGKTGYVLEHIVVMEHLVGRDLLPEETVHHKNGVKDDNRPENLELWCSSHKPGQRAEDLVKWVVQAYPDLVEKAILARMVQ